MAFVRLFENSRESQAYQLFQLNLTQRCFAILKQHIREVHSDIHNNRSLLLKVISSLTANIQHSKNQTHAASTFFSTRRGRTL